MNDHSLTFPKPLALLVAAAMLGLLTMAGMNTTAAEAKVTQPSCGKLKKQKKKACKANAKVYNQVKDSIFVGARTDGIEVATIYCANGRVQDGYGTGFPSPVLKAGWKVVDAKFKSPKNFSGVLEAKIEGGTFVQGVIRNGNTWKVGYEFGGKINAAGDVVRTKASKECGKL